MISRSKILSECLTAAYAALFEAESINNASLTRIAGDAEKLKSAKAHINSLWVADSMDDFVKNQKQRDQLKNLLTFSYLKGADVNRETISAIHDMAVANKLAAFNGLNTTEISATAVSDVINKFRSAETTKGVSLSDDDMVIFNRVKLVHDFGDGFKWVQAVDENGAPVGFMPSRITQQLMRHCGNEPSCQTGDQYFELRNSGGPVLTVIVNAEGELEESKGYDNQIPANMDEIRDHVKWLLRSKYVVAKGNRYAHGYAPDRNVGVKDMDSEFVEEMRQSKPRMIHPDVEGVILFYRKAIADGEYTVDEFLERYTDGDFTTDLHGEEKVPLSSLRAIVGDAAFNKYATDDRLIELIDDDIVNAFEIANTSTALMTPAVQMKVASDSMSSQYIQIASRMYGINPNKVYLPAMDVAVANGGSTWPNLIANVELRDIMFDRMLALDEIPLQSQWLVFKYSPAKFLRKFGMLSPRAVYDSLQMGLQHSDDDVYVNAITDSIVHYFETLQDNIEYIAANRANRSVVAPTNMLRLVCNDMDSDIFADNVARIAESVGPAYALTSIKLPEVYRDQFIRGISSRKYGLNDMINVTYPFGHNATNVITSIFSALTQALGDLAAPAFRTLVETDAMNDKLVKHELYDHIVSKLKASFAAE